MVATHSSVESGEPIAQSKVSSELYILRDLGMDGTILNMEKYYKGAMSTF
ncbi:UNVERIFIED_CONTAM: hypothetical protein Sradi_4121200 [Sesamum radiatum]|uniref:Uncharacterized protein n=1 Tax=Sesamum radiatum TaxID=300843 RepID=A0AAW2P3K3_SESRA